MTTNKQALFSSARTGSGRDDWQTPESVLTLVRRVGEIALDPCAPADNNVGAAKFHTEHGETHDWKADAGGGLVFVNPPYSQLRVWMDKCARAAAAGATIISLIPARTDTKAWKLAMKGSPTVAFWQQRIKFVGGAHVAQFPSAFIYWGCDPGRFALAFSPHATMLDAWGEW